MTEKMREELNYLMAIRPKVSHLIGNPVDEQLEQNYPDYFARVVKLIRKMGALTELEGHSETMDQNKNSAYRLIGL
jgi:hypothetical protein